MALVFSDELRRLWDLCVPSHEGRRDPTGMEFAEQTDALALGLAFRWRDHIRPKGDPFRRVLHSQGVVALVRWLPAEDTGFGGILTDAQIALLRLSNTVEAPILSGGGSHDDFLLGAALKFIPPTGPSANLLFVSSGAGCPAPTFLSEEPGLSTQAPEITAATPGIHKGRLQVVAFFQAAVEALKATTHPAPDDINTFPLGPPLLEAQGQTLPLALDLVPLAAEVAEGPAFRVQYRDAPHLQEGTDVYSVVARLPGGATREIAKVQLQTAFRVSEWADSNLYFSHAQGPVDVLTSPPTYLELEEHLTIEQIEERARAASVSVVRWRFRVILLLKSRHSVAETCKLVGYSRATTTGLARLYNLAGPDILEKHIDDELPAVGEDERAELFAKALESTSGGLTDVGAELSERLGTKAFLFDEEWVRVLSPRAD